MVSVQTQISCRDYSPEMIPIYMYTGTHHHPACKSKSCSSRHFLVHTAWEHFVIKISPHMVLVSLNDQHLMLLSHRAYTCGRVNLQMLTKIVITMVLFQVTDSIASLMFSTQIYNVFTLYHTRHICTGGCQCESPYAD